MNHKDKLLEIYKKSSDISDIKNINRKDKEYLELVTSNINSNKGVYTVLVTLLVHKLLESKQDIRYFQNKMEGGFSARTLDTKYITPTLKELGLPSMAESGWLTRSLEQPYPYTLNYEGEISGKGMKEAFLKIIDSFQNKPKFTENFLRFILNGAILHRENNKVEINKLEGTEELFISNITNLLEEHFSFKYNTHGGSKLPVLAFYAMYQILIEEMGRYKGCDLLDLGSHTASDRTSKSSGDIEVNKNGKLFEAVEVKLDKKIDITMARIAYEKIKRYNPRRYYILAYAGVIDEDREDIENLINKIRNEHGCQLIINGLLHTLRYYMRLINSPVDFFNNYVSLVEKDKELKKSHKIKLEELMKEFEL
jgi:DNA (cytosine-5)-methyltransferase 1